jgi:hypothetical protein
MQYKGCSSSLNEITWTGFLGMDQIMFRRSLPRQTTIRQVKEMILEAHHEVEGQQFQFDLGIGQRDNFEYVRDDNHPIKAYVVCVKKFCFSPRECFWQIFHDTIPPKQIHFLMLPPRENLEQPQ